MKTESPFRKIRISPMHNVHNLSEYKIERQIKNICVPYKEQIKEMSILDLFGEIAQFQLDKSRRGLDLELFLKGRILYLALRDSATTSILKILANSYVSYLESEMTSFLSNHPDISQERIDALLSYV
jgi:hypothetical protein